MKKYICVLLLFQVITITAQKRKPLDTVEYSKRTSLVSQYKLQHTAFNEQIRKKYRGKLGNQAKKFYENAQESFLKIIEKKKITFDDRFQRYTDSLTRIVIKQNPELEKENIRVLISKEPTPNAISIGDGTIIINLGLFAYLENEQQLASVISHELAHQLLRHTESTVIMRSEYETSKERKQKTRTIKRRTYGKYELAFGELKSILYSVGKERKHHEMQADSLGYIIFKKSNFIKKEFVGALEHLSKLDSVHNGNINEDDYKNFFTIPEYGFKEDWLKIEQFSGYNYKNYKEKINRDSIKSHPETLERILHLKTTFSELNDVSPESKVKNNTYSILKEIAQQEEISSLFHLEQYGLSIYTALKKIKANEIPENEMYYYRWLGENFLKLYEAKKSYKMNRYVDTVVPNKQSENYQLFLNFIWNLRLDDLKAIGDYYVEKGNQS